MDNSGVTFEFNGTETIIVFNIIGNLLDANAIKEDQLEIVNNLHKSIYEKLKPYVVQQSDVEVDVSGVEVDVSGVEVDVSGVEVDVSGVEVDVSGVEVQEDDGSGIGEYDGSGVEDCQDGVCKLEIPTDCCCDGPTDCSNN